MKFETNHKKTKTINDKTINDKNQKIFYFKTIPASAGKCTLNLYQLLLL
jgi:hypothetical protein